MMNNPCKLLSRCGLAWLFATAMLAALASSASAAEFDQFGFESVSAELSSHEAGAHPDFTTVIAMKKNPNSILGELPYAALKDVAAEPPPGLLGNLNAVNPCAETKFLTAMETLGEGCPFSAQVGIVEIHFAFAPSGIYNKTPIFRLESAGEDNIARFGFMVTTVPVYLNVRARSGSDYGLSAETADLNATASVQEVRTTLWGVPAAAAHDTLRFTPLEMGEGRQESEPRSTGLEPRPFLRNPTSCGESLSVHLKADSYQEPGRFAEADAPLGEITDCDKVGFEPAIEARPTTDVSDSPAGLHLDLHVPQHEAPDELAAADLRDSVVKLAPGLTINPSSANGLQACTPAQIGLTTPVGVTPIHTTAAPAQCPEAARIGSVEVDTPLLDHPLSGVVYVAQPHQNPFGSLLALYIVIHDPGVTVKLAGHVVADPDTGQLTTTFAENPQLPFEDLKLRLFSGAAAPLRTPAVCATYESNSVLTPWSAPASGPPATPADSYAISRSPAGGNCPHSAGEEPSSPGFDAGTVSPISASYSPLVIHLRREDGSQNFSAVTFNPPPGLLGRLAGIPYCPEAALAAAAQKPGSAEQASPSCPAASQVGTVEVGAGAGPAPYYTQGKAYLAGPYKGAPLSLAVITPATAGPFDLGTVVVRTTLQLDPASTRITAASDPIPSILDGIPLDVRSIDVSLDRPDFTRNGTSCDPLSFNGGLLSTLGQTAPLAERFQLAECSRLGFKPKLSFRLKGGVKRGAHPALRATLTYPKKGAYANIARAAVTLPHSEFLDQGHIKTVCTRVQFAASQCPPNAVYGHARAFTPLLEAPLEGPVYLRSSDHQLPDLVADLNGQIHVVLDGRIDSVNGAIRTTFEAVPDAPVSKFVLEMQGAKKGLLQNSTNICSARFRADARFKAQDADVADLRPELKNRRCAGRGHHAKHRVARGSPGAVR